MRRRAWLGLLAIWVARTAVGNAGARRAVVDRLHGDDAVLVVAEPPRQHVIALDRLPPPARAAGAVVRIYVASGRVVDVASAPDATARRRAAAGDRLESLAEREAADRSDP